MNPKLENQFSAVNPGRNDFFRLAHLFRVSGVSEMDGENWTVE